MDFCCQINENSQAAKNSMIEAALKHVVEPFGHEVINYGMYTTEDTCQLTYVQVGILAAVLLNSSAVDYVITGCGTGEMLLMPKILLVLLNLVMFPIVLLESLLK